MNNWKKPEIAELNVNMTEQLGKDGKDWYECDPSDIWALGKYYYVDSTGKTIYSDVNPFTSAS